MDGRLLCRIRPRCSSAPQIYAAKLPGWPQSSHRTVRAKVTNLERGSAEDSLEDIMHVLQDAFSTNLTNKDQKPLLKANDQPNSSTAHQGLFNSRMSSRAGASTASASGRSPSEPSFKRSSSSSNAGGTSSISDNKSTNSKAAGVKKHRGPFGDLLTALEADMRRGSSKPKATRSNVTSSISHQQTDFSSSSSATTSSDSSADMMQTASPTRHNSKNNSSSDAISNTPRKFVRRVRSQQHSEQGSKLVVQQQQRTANTSGKNPLVQQQQQQQQQEEPSWLRHPLISSVSRKQFKPVNKGDLALPGGPAWSALRRHIAAAGSTPDLPIMNCIVIVEGDQDQTAVARAVNAPVYVCDGTRVLKEHVRPELEVLKLLGRPLVVLTDPDERGRELRVHLENLIGPLQHAFVPEQQGTSTVDGPVHSSGNRGIEHVVPGGIQKALAAAKPSFSKDRAVWTLDKLIELGLANAHDAGDAAVGRGAAVRRRQFCAVLGFGRCSGGQLVALMNRFCDDEMVEEALKMLEAADEQ